MKRNKIIGMVLCFAIATVGLMLGACSHDTNSNRLATPTNLRVVDGIFAWNSVNHAVGYYVYIDDDEFMVTETRFDVSWLKQKGRQYDLYVQALGDGKHYVDSEKANISYKYTPPPVVPTPNLSYELLGDGSGYEVSRGNANLDGKIVIPDYYEGLPVKRIAQEAFGKDGLNLPTNALTTGVRLPNTLEEIGDKAFIRCIALAEVEIPDSVIVIGAEAFYGCKKLERVKLSSMLYELSSQAFCGCQKLEYLTLPSNLKIIGDGAFMSSGLKTVTIPDGVTRLEDEVLEDCLSLAEIRFPKNIEFFGSSVVSGTRWLENQPDGVVAVQGYMCGFNGTIPSGSELTIPPEVKHISGNAFFGQKAEDITLIIPDGVTIGDGAFAYFRGLKSIRLPADLICIPYRAFDRCTSLESIHIPESVIEIGEYAFCNCNALSSLELPSKLEKIGREAFMCRNLTMLRIPDSVTELGSMYNDYIRQIIMSPTLAATVPQLPSNVYKSVYITCTPEENEYNYEELFKGQNLARITFYLYVQDEQDIPDDGGNYWHYDEDGKTPVVW